MSTANVAVDEAAAPVNFRLFLAVPLVKASGFKLVPFKPIDAAFQAVTVIPSGAVNVSVDRDPAVTDDGVQLPDSAFEPAT